MGEKQQCVVTSHAPPLRTWPDWESNHGPFGLQTGAQATEPHEPGLK